MEDRNCERCGLVEPGGVRGNPPLWADENEGSFYCPSCRNHRELVAQLHVLQVLTEQVRDVFSSLMPRQK
jgi:hypothetical protein